ncbi:hypothetical protein [Lapidilactobacillus luobeiensis]|uniref:hypothetical protein n=1 Tax=Lapidilactobacillus luobeiensis TaxID=2950371 RepID=UPI0021C3112F|nr:hypothetical protein [Lapidilactobacillus luobeiensis]
MTTYYLLNQTIGGINSQFIFDRDYHPLMIITGRFGFNQSGLQLLTIAGQYVGSVTQLRNRHLTTFRIEKNGREIGQMNRLGGVWHQFAFVSGLNWTILGSVANNTYQVTHGVRQIFSTEPTITKKNLDGLKLTITPKQDQADVFLVAATLNQWVLWSQRKPHHLTDPFMNIATN